MGSAPTLTIDSYAHLEKPPPEWGMLCEVRAFDSLAQAQLEKPPPRWGGVCEGGGYSILSLLLGKTPTGVGCALRGQLTQLLQLCG